MVYKSSENLTAAGFVSSISGTANQITITPTTGDAVASLPASILGISALTDGATITPDFSAGRMFWVQLGGSRTLGTPTNISVAVGRGGTINVSQDATGGRTLSYSWAYSFPGGVAPTLSTNGLAMDALQYVVNKYGTSTVTMTIAAPCVVTWTSHGLISGDKVQFTTTGALPTGLTASTTYYVTKVDADTFKLSTTLANAAASAFITTSGSQSGVHTATNISITVGANLGVI